MSILRTHPLSFRTYGLLARYFAHIVFPSFTQLSVSSPTLINNALQLVYLDEIGIPTAWEFFVVSPRYFQSDLSARPGHLLAGSIYS